MINYPELFATLFERLTLGATITYFPTNDPGDGYLIAANAAASRVLGFDLAPFIGQAPNQTDVPDGFDEDENAASQQRSFDVAVHETPLILNEFEVEHGPIRGHYQASLFSLGDRTVASVFRRVDGEVAASEALNWAMETIEASNTQLEQFASTVAHDLKNPLTGIAGNAEILQMMHADMPPAALELVQRIQQLTTLSSEMIDGVLQFSRNPKRSEQASVDLEGDVLGWVRDVLQDQIQSAGATLTTEMLPLVSGHSAALRQVFQNLIANSLRYRSPDRTCRIDIRTVSGPSGVAIDVVDNGIGIPEEYRQQVFEWGFQGDHGERPQGSGFGLAACRAVLLNLGADIEVGPEPAGGGTTMRLLFRSP